MSSIKRAEMNTAAFLDDLSTIPNHRNVDTSRSRSSQILRELKKARRDARTLAQQSLGINNKKGSPYVEDRKRVHEFKGTEKETQWQVVETRAQSVARAQAQDMLEARERELHSARMELNKRKLNII